MQILKKVFTPFTLVLLILIIVIIIVCLGQSNLKNSGLQSEISNVNYVQGEDMNEPVTGATPKAHLREAMFYQLSFISVLEIALLLKGKEVSVETEKIRMGFYII